MKPLFIDNLEMNAGFNNIELTSNFLFSERLPKNHYPSILTLIEKHLPHPGKKGAVYFSPMLSSNEKDTMSVKRKFFDLKRKIKLPAYLYLIQRL